MTLIFITIMLVSEGVLFLVIFVVSKKESLILLLLIDIDELIFLFNYIFSILIKTRGFFSTKIRCLKRWSGPTDSHAAMYQTICCGLFKPEDMGDSG